MAWHDDVAELRGQKLASKQASDLHGENIDAVLGGSENVVAAIDKVAKSDDIDHVIKELKEIQLSTLLGASKPSVILTDQTDLGDKISELAGKFDTSLKQLDTSITDAEEIKQLKVLNQALQDFMKSIKASNADDTKTDKALIAAVKAIDVKPVVNVPAPKVNVQAPSIDLSPLQDTLRQYLTSEETEEKVDLDDFKAQDIDNTNPDVQYVGFVNPDGNWYIIENDVKGNRIRYVFGVTDYQQAFANAAMYTYTLLNEAINALAA